MNLKVITNLAKLCELCASEEKFSLQGLYDYRFQNGILMIYRHNNKLVPVNFRINDLINFDIKVVKDDEGENK